MESKSGPIAAVMVHVPDWREGFDWYLKAFSTARIIEVPELKWSYLEVDGVGIEVVNADSKVGVGTAGTVTYWWTRDFNKRLAELESLGAQLYRGPLNLEDGERMCQVKDPFGNLMGLRGPAGE